MSRLLQTAISERAQARPKTPAAIVCLVGVLTAALPGSC
jgi:hypothetical protein